MLTMKAFLTALAGVASLSSFTVAKDADQKPLGTIPHSSRPPNVVFILTDDQDLHMDSLNYMQHVQKNLIDEGTFFRHHFCTVAVCCPSRVNIWTGKAAHNTNVTDLFLPYGGYEKFVQEGLNSAYLPVWLQSGGYNTYYTGKLFNAHRTDNYDKPFPASWTGSDFLLDPFTYSYLNSTFQRNQDPPKSYEGQYSVDVLAEKTLGFLDDAVEADRPFFLVTAPVAPHSNVEFIPKDFDKHIIKAKFFATPPVAAKRHEHLFPDAKVPRHASFNPDEPSGVNWIRELPQQNATNVDYNDLHYRQRLRSLQSVDELVDALIQRLDAYGILDNTYIIYTSDNGYSIGQHRRQPGKESGYEEDVNVPLIIRGPGVPQGVTTEIMTSHTDLVPTIFDIVGLTPHRDFDGAAIPLNAETLAEADKSRHEHVNVEYWGWAVSEGKYGRAMHVNNTYKSLRLVGEGYNYYYSVWCNNVHELYDLHADPWQMRNLYSSADSLLPSDTLLGLPLEAVLHRLDSLLLVLKSCRARECTHPWEVLHPAGDVHTLHDALHPRFNEYYTTQVARVRFDRCENGYIVDAEGPQQATGYRDGLVWSEWV